MNTQTDEVVALRPMQAVKRYNISKTRLYAYIGDGTLQTVKLGRARLILRESLDRLITPPAKAA